MEIDGQAMISSPSHGNISDLDFVEERPGGKRLRRRKRVSFAPSPAPSPERLFKKPRTSSSDDDYQDDSSQNGVSAEDDEKFKDDDEYHDDVSLEEHLSDEYEEPEESLSDKATSVSEGELDEDLDEAGAVTEELEPAPTKRKPAIRKNAAVARPRPNNGIDLSLPPISAIDDIFLDITTRALQFDLSKAIKHLGQRPLRVATMCSGTEAPLLSLKLVERALKHLHQPTLNIEHVFSAEIEPFKQAYIERNFKPPILFRDITEFIFKDSKKDSSAPEIDSEDPEIDSKGPEATTVYGSKLHVPRDIDILVAGSSCVDNSVLNNEKKEINKKSTGESSRTFFALLGYAKRVRPPIIILENVIDGKAWKQYERYFRESGFATQIIKADTKRYYIPHTRLRKYMICLDKQLYGAEASAIAKRWGDVMIKLERRASTPVTSFLLSNDDPRYKIMQSNSWVQDAVQRSIDWEACRGRHEKARANEGLGHKRPVTKFLPEWSDRFIRKRPERDQDVIDIQYLRYAIDGTDLLYKTRIMDLSQNVDRQAKSANGISGCLTPRGFPFITDQCRPLSGYENLLLQGIPIDDILFTSESDSDLKDLAGNAMSSTVVGSALLASIIVAYKGIIKSHNGREDGTLTPFVDDKPHFTLCHEKYLVKVPAADNRATLAVPTLLRDAAQSARFCSELCEGTGKVTKTRLMRCKGCGHTACFRCGGNPIHQYIDHKQKRITPDAFETRWRKAFPLQLKVENLPDFDSWSVNKEYITAVRKGLSEVLTLEGLHRGRQWTVSYVADAATLELRLCDKPTWSLFVKPPPHSPAGSKLRETLKHPVARSRLGDTADELALGWEWFIPTTRTANLTIKGSRAQLPSWRSKIGLQQYKTETQSETLTISADKSFGTDISGSYTLQPRCGTACDSLYARSSNPLLYFFLDPDPIATEDSFVFTETHHRLDLNEIRQPILIVDSSWRPWGNLPPTSVTATSPGTWVFDQDITLRVVESSIQHSVTDPEAPWDAIFSTSTCSDATIVLSTCCIGTTAHSQLNESFPSVKNLQLWKQFAWMLTEVNQLKHLSEWMDISSSLVTGRCGGCSPVPPSVKWRAFANTMMMYEDHIEAAGLERKMKARPEPFRIQLEPGKTTTINLAISLASLAHRAAANLLPLHAESACWNLDSNYRDPGDVTFSKFSLCSNANDKQHTQPARMLHRLRDDQLRSLHWMVKQEIGIPFILSEVEEALIPQLNWKVEVKASTKVTVRGGVLADQPSYGKTVTTLALIHDEFSKHSKDQIAPVAKAGSGLLHLAATLIITPHHLSWQWRDEVNKFLPNAEYTNKDVLLLRTLSDLKSKSIADFKRAKIVIASWNIFESPDYGAHLAKLSALHNPGAVKGRQYKTWLQFALPRLKDNVPLLDGGIKSFSDKLEKKAADFHENDELDSFVLPSRRKKPAATGKGNAKDAAPEAAPKAARVDIKLRGVKGRDDKESLAFPLFHMFRWNRIVVDEFSYLLQKTYSVHDAVYASVTGLDAKNRWVLSGTPPLANFADVKMIAKFLDVNLGIDDYDPRLASRKNLTDIRRELSPVERFRSYQDRRSVHWHKMRHQLAQGFLDGFVRQNDADVENIKCYPALEPVTLGASHRAVYEELSQYLASLEMQARKAASLGASRDVEINDCLEQSASAEEALLYRASVFDTNLGTMIERRHAQLKGVTDQLYAKIKKAEAVAAKAGPAEQHYRDWKTEDIRDIEGNKILKALLNKASKQAAQASNVSSDEAITKLRKEVLELRPLARELASRLRSKRYVENIKKMQDGDTTLECIKGNECATDDLRVISSCGHLVCPVCLTARPRDSCVVKGCGGHVDELHIKSVDDFGVDTGKKSDRFGAKVKSIVNLIRHKIPPKDQVVIFVPSYLLMGTAGTTLEHYDIPHFCIEQNERSVQTIVKNFQNTGKVLILNMADEQASGL